MVLFNIQPLPSRQSSISVFAKRFRRVRIETTRNDNPIQIMTESEFEKLLRRNLWPIRRSLKSLKFSFLIVCVGTGEFQWKVFTRSSSIPLELATLLSDFEHLTVQIWFKWKTIKRSPQFEIQNILKTRKVDLQEFLTRISCFFLRCPKLEFLMISS